jgi:hypothetical protein
MCWAAAKKGSHGHTLACPSCDKLKLSAFDPYICKTDRYLAGWQASFLNPMGQDRADQRGARWPAILHHDGRVSASWSNRQD